MNHPYIVAELSRYSARHAYITGKKPNIRNLSLYKERLCHDLSITCILVNLSFTYNLPENSWYMLCCSVSFIFVECLKL